MRLFLFSFFGRGRVGVGEGEVVVPLRRVAVGVELQPLRLRVPLVPRVPVFFAIFSRCTPVFFAMRERARAMREQSCAVGNFAIFVIFRDFRSKFRDFRIRIP